MQDDQRQDSRFMATYKLTWLFLRSLERGGVSELGLAQSADSFPATHSTQRTVTFGIVP
jgi:hypothetical protein